MNSIPSPRNNSNAFGIIFIVYRNNIKIRQSRLRICRISTFTLFCFPSLNRSKTVVHYHPCNLSLPHFTKLYHNLPSCPALLPWQTNSTLIIYKKPPSHIYIIDRLSLPLSISLTIESYNTFMNNLDQHHLAHLHFPSMIFLFQMFLVHPLQYQLPPEFSL